MKFTKILYYICWIILVIYILNAFYGLLWGFEECGGFIDFVCGKGVKAFFLALLMGLVVPRIGNIIVPIPLLVPICSAYIFSYSLRVLTKKINKS